MSEANGRRGHYMTSYMLRVCSAVAQIITAAGVVFWVGVNWERLNKIENSVKIHTEEDWHGTAGNRIFAIETNILNLTKSVDRLVNRLDEALPVKRDSAE